jgi:hypothetical protein
MREGDPVHVFFDDNDPSSHVALLDSELGLSTR